MARPSAEPRREHGRTLIRIVCVLVVAILIAIVARRLRLPYTIGLVIVGAAIAVLKIDFG